MSSSVARDNVERAFSFAVYSVIVYICRVMTVPGSIVQLFILW